MRQVGILQILLSGICFGFLGLFGKWAFAAGLTPGEFLALRFLTASGLLGAWLLAQNPRALQLPRAVLFRCAALGVGGYALFSSCYFQALHGLPASLTALLLYTYPVMVSLGAWLFFRERLRTLDFFSLPIVTGGLGLLIGAEFEIYAPIALLFGFFSAVFYSAYILVSSRWLRGVPPLTSTFYVMLSAGITLGALHLRPSITATLPNAMPVVLATALVGTLAAMSLFLAGLQKLKSSEASILSTAEPVTGVLLALIWLGERLSFWQGMGGGLILAGMVLTALTPRK